MVIKARETTYVAGKPLFYVPAAGGTAGIKTDETIRTSSGNIGNLHGKALFAKYLTKHGGYAGQRELGYMAWLLSHIAANLLAGDVKGAQEVTALALCAVDEACQDGNKWDVAFLIALLEEPPSSGLQLQRFECKSEDEGLLATCPPELGIDYTDVCPRDGSDGITPSRSNWFGIEFPKSEGRGCCNPKEEAAISEEAKGWPRKVTSKVVGGGNRDDGLRCRVAAPHVLDRWCLDCHPASESHTYVIRQPNTV